ncbi:MAG: hypothetical protein P8J89_02645, partial [Phycisphaerales bacterium]|nr:hypothetical protein [Phycisphaerales bacterium]
MNLFDDRSTKIFAVGFIVGMLSMGTSVVFAQAWQSAGSETPSTDTSKEQADSGDASKADASKVDAAKVNSGLLAAQRLERESRWREAADKYAEVLKLVPDNKQAREGYQKAMQMLDDGSMLSSGTGAGMAGVELQMQEQRQRAEIEFKDAINRAQDLLNKEDFIAADRTILTGQIKLRQRRQYLSEAEFTNYNSQAEALIQRISQARINSQLLKEQAEREEASQSRSATEQREQAERSKIITESLLRVRKLQEELKYREALQVVDEILFIDPQNPAALALRDVMETAMVYRDYSDAERQKSMAYAHQWVDLQRALIPPKPNLSGPGERSINGLYGYPEDWPQITYRRGEDAGYRVSPADRRVMKLMEEKVEINFVDMPFNDVLEYFTQAIAGLQIYPDWKEMDQELAITRETPVTIQLTSLPLDIGLGRVLEQVGDSDDHPAWEIQDGMLLISTEEKLNERKHVVVYDVRDLVLPIPDYDSPPDLNLGGGGGG